MSNELENNDMKQILSVIIILLSTSLIKAQTYIEGWRVIPFSQVANSSLLPQNQRLSTTASFAKLKEIEPTTTKKAPDEMTGEYWLIDGMLIQLVTRQISSEWPKNDLEDFRLSLIPDVGGEISNPHRPALLRQKDDFFTEIKSVNNFEVLVFYYKTMWEKKSFILYDNMNRYGIIGSVYAKKEDYNKAHTFINTLLNSITFK